MIVAKINKALCVVLLLSLDPPDVFGANDAAGQHRKNTLNATNFNDDRAQEHSVPFVSNSGERASFQDMMDAYGNDEQPMATKSAAEFGPREVYFMLTMTLVIVVSIVTWRHNAVAIRKYSASLQTEISQRRSTENLLAERERELSTLINNLPGGAFRCLADSNWTMLFMSDGCATITGYPVQEMLMNRAVSNNSIILADDREDFRKLVMNAVKKRVRYEGKYRILTKDGSIRHVMEQGVAVSSNSNGIAIIEGLMLDITEHSLAEEDREAARLEAFKANEAKTQFLATMSHELRTPLNAISGFSEMMITQTFGPLGHQKYSEYAGHIHASGAHLLSIVNDILDLSKIEAGEFQLKPKILPLEPMIAESLSLVRFQKERAPEQLMVNIGNAAKDVFADQRSLTQILINLVSNADKYTPIDGEIRIVARKAKSGSTSIEVSDTGVGIPDDEISRVLEPFSQAKQDIDVSHSGTGLGLSVSKRLMDLHGGMLEVTSAVNEGTTVRLTFPPMRV